MFLLEETLLQNENSNNLFCVLVVFIFWLFSKVILFQFKSTTF